MAAEQYGATSSKMMPRLVVFEHPNVVKDPERLEKLAVTIFGIYNHSIAVLEEGMTFTSSIPPDQAQFLDTRKFQLDEIARIFVYHAYGW